MTREEIYSIIREVLTQEIAQRVAQALITRQKRALVVYTGSNLGFRPALDSLIRLKSEGFSFDMLLSHSAAGILDVPAIREALNPGRVISGEPDFPPESLSASFDTILVPALTVNTAARLAACMADSPAARVVMNGLMRGKNVIIANDGCCPENLARIHSEYHLAPGLADRLRTNLERLRSYGARITTSDRLYDSTWKCIRGGALCRLEPDQKTGLPEVAGSSFEGRVLGHGAVSVCADNSVLRISKGTLVTQYASDEARRKNVKIIVG